MNRARIEHTARTSSHVQETLSVPSHLVGYAGADFVVRQAEHVAAGVVEMASGRTVISLRALADRAESPEPHGVVVLLSAESARRLATSLTRMAEEQEQAALRIADEALRRAGGRE